MSNRYEVIDDGNSQGTTHTSKFLASDGDDTVLVRTDVDGGGTWLLRATKENSNVTSTVT